MIKNYFKIAWRSLSRNKGFTTLNILGLALGLAACLLIVLYVVDELSYDRYNEKASRMYRVNEDLKLGDNKMQFAVAMPPLAKTLKHDFPEVENTVRLRPTGFHVKKGTESIPEPDVVFADASVFDVFTLPMIYGDRSSALAEPNTVVLSASAALKYFNKLNVVGQTLTIENNQILKITGVINDMPKQSHFHADFLESLATQDGSRSNNWISSNYNTYILFREGADPKKLEAQFPQLLRNYAAADIQHATGGDIDAFEKSGSHFRLSLTALTAIHLHSNLVGEMEANSSAQYVYIFSAIALFILIIACVNFMNLSTARSANRAREVGVRKVLGSARSYLIGQFLTESILITLISAIIALVIVIIALPAFNNLSGKNITLNIGVLTWLIPAIFVGVLAIGSLAGLYPAIFLSAFNPINVLKGTLANGFKGSNLRSSLVIFQFAISIFLITATLVIYGQLKYIQNRDIGYNRNQVLVVKNSYELGNKARAFKQEIKQIPEVANATLSGFLPTSGARAADAIFKDQSKDPKKTIMPQLWQVDNDYITTLGMKVVAGRNFSDKMPTDSDAVVINETAAKFLGYANPVNKILYRPADNNSLKAFTIIGVVKDFNFSSLRENVTPVVMFLNRNNGNLGIKVNTADISGLLSKIENKWKSFAPAIKIDYSFMDTDFDAIYRTEQRMGKIFIIFTVLAIVIACLGLFGLSAYAAEQRIKEIGIRKVLGASVYNIAQMLSLNFIKLVCIAVLISSPVTYYIMQKWLQDFAYRITIQWWLLAISGLSALLIALITVSLQTIKAAVANPIKSLRTE
ncbi:FtsX-like permease family protein [Mucilaginibacter corticis]|uniref:FtsX-like permease family protein n=1 Tax=Mucilaginibacter corticis TaxID=2597670 RepID=A0A556MT00_9SPHI|nr:ABC transporter permease [Mucilaginibacter corticis]TSJ43036.1 FtsX-like permease family protein [Mucilaginibacter corticis]